MVVANTLRRTSSSSSSSSGHDWDVVGAATVARLERPFEAPATPDGSGEEEGQSFVMVAATNEGGADTQQSTTDVSASNTQHQQRRKKPKRVPKSALAFTAPQMASAAAEEDEEGEKVAQGVPFRPNKVLAALAASPPELQPSVDQVRLRMERSPSLPGTPPVAATPPPTAPPAVVWRSVVATPPAEPAAAPKPDERLLRDTRGVQAEEEINRHLVEKDHVQGLRTIQNELRTVTTQQGTSESDAAYARRVAAEEHVAQLREAEDRRVAALIAEQERAKKTPSRRCDCLGASAGHHRPGCPTLR